MKTFTIYVLFLLVSIATCFSQDVITLKSGDKILSKVLEVNIDNVKYKRFDMQEGQTYTIKKQDIFMIEYVNGQKDVFDVNEKQNGDYNFTKQGYSTKYWKGTKAISKDEFLSALRSNPSAYNEYSSGKQLQISGNILAIPSAAVVGWELGLLIGRSGNEDIELENSLLNFSTPAMIIGAVGLAGGITMILIGNSKINKSISILNKSQDVSLNFNISPNSAGIVFNF